MKSLPLSLALAMLGLSLTSTVAQAAVAAARKPNVVYLLADDLGWGDLSRNGGKIPTPAIDKLFTRGVELNNFMGWCVCSPTRANLMTGRYNYRTRVVDTFKGRSLMDPDVTLARL